MIVFEFSILILFVHYRNGLENLTKREVGLEVHAINHLWKKISMFCHLKSRTTK